LRTGAELDGKEERDGAKERAGEANQITRIADLAEARVKLAVMAGFATDPTFIAKSDTSIRTSKTSALNRGSILLHLLRSNVPKCEPTSCRQ
jgi:hypothetical protein